MKRINKFYRHSCTLSESEVYSFFHGRNPVRKVKVKYENCAVYILANKRNGTLYIGVTSNLIKRVWEHKNNIIKGFTSKYGVKKLVYYQNCESMESAIIREKQIKTWKRNWKIREIEEMNPNWNDLYFELV